ncbi:MAG: metallophosphoesterase family protein [Rhodomicrobium sp.]|nr:metallophosphoesterase family protein [Rhodomicrobium sp.]
MTVIGLISDTHGLLRPQAAAALAGVSRILHAGDVGKPEILAQLAAIAPVTAVRGNVDLGGWALELPVAVTTAVEGHSIHMVHNPAELSINPALENVSVVVLGHTHKPLIETRGGVLYINPGSAGPRRFSLPVSIGFLRLAENAPPEAWLQTFDVAAS